MANINVFDTNNIKSTGLTVNGVTVLSGNSSASILTVTGQTGTFMEVIDDSGSDLLWGISGDTGAVFDVNIDSINAYVDFNHTGNTITSGNTIITGSLSATTKSFDKIKEEFNISKIDFMKIDCEGGEYSVFNNRNIFWIKENVKKIVGEWHLETPEKKEKFRVFRDTYLRLFPNVKVFSVDGVDIKWDLWNEHFLDYYFQVIIYIDNRD